MKKIISNILCASLLCSVGLYAEKPARAEAETKEEKNYPSRVIDLIEREESLPELLEKYPMVLVAFEGASCGACSDIDEVLAETSMKDTKVKVIKVNLDKLSHYMKKYKIQGLPTFIYFKNGQEIDRQRANRSAAELINKIQNNFYNKGPRYQVTQSYDAPTSKAQAKQKVQTEMARSRTQQSAEKKPAPERKSYSEKRSSKKKSRSISY